MVVGVGSVGCYSHAEGETCIVDGDQSIVIASPDQRRLEAVRGAMTAAASARDRAMASRALPTVTRDGTDRTRPRQRGDADGGACGA